MKEGVDRCRHEEEDNQGGHDGADNLESLEPYLVVPADGLEHAPEAMAEVEPDCGKPDQVDYKHPPLAEGRAEEIIRIILEIPDAEHFRKLHLGPEMGQVEEQDSKDDDSEDEHVLGCPRIGGGYALCLVTLETTTSLDVLHGNDDSVKDMDEEAEGKYGNHDVDEGRGHEVAPKLEQAVSGGEQFFVSCNCTEFSGERVDDGEEIDCAVKQEEKYEESPADSLNKLPADRIMESVRHYRKDLW